jgi:ribonuclease R
MHSDARTALTRHEVLRLVRERAHHPSSARELAQLLQVPREQRASLRRQLKSLVADGALVEVRGRRYGLADMMDLVVGRLQAKAGGFAFVVPDRGPGVPPVGGAGTGGAGFQPADHPDVFIAETNLDEAMHGDRVVARIERYRTPDRPEGRIVKILQRANTTLVGRFDVDAAGLGVVVPFDLRVQREIAVPASETRGARPGQMVTVEISRWPTETRGPIGRVTEVLGDIDDPGVDTTIIVRKYGLPDAHGHAAVAEARRMLGGRESPRTMHAHGRDVAGRTDFRGLDIVTIDGEHARDFDDAISVERLESGHFRLGVHIADVSHYVREGSALDAEACERGTSVYFPDRALHMFPEELATGLCSLNPRVDRLVQSCLMDVDRQGTVVSYEFHDGVIRTRERMTYTDVNAILTGDVAARARCEALLPLLERMRELFEILNDRRRRLGSIDFDFDVAEVELDEAGQVEAIVASERNVAHRLIEEFMLLANETVAAYLDASPVPGLFRVHEPPDPIKVGQFEAFVSGLGHSLAAPPDLVRPGHFQALLKRVRGTPEERPIAVLMLRTMQKARYAPENLGHFGLAFSSYTHFTSPIRRYPDLLVHRLLRLARRADATQEQSGELAAALPDLARHASDRERRADEAERELVHWKKVRFMRDKVGEEFDGFVTGVTSFGLFVEIVDPLVDGLVHLSTMADDYYHFLDATHALRGEHTRKVYRLGDRVRVRVLQVDLDKRQIELGLAEILAAVRRDGRGRAGRPANQKADTGRRQPVRRRQRPGRNERRRRG